MSHMWQYGDTNGFHTCSLVMFIQGLGFQLAIPCCQPQAFWPIIVTQMLSGGKKIPDFFPSVLVAVLLKK
jgi:hypothetical protein